jgi:RNA polymerase sigma-70 factor, ECF subfamily
MTHGRATARGSRVSQSIGDQRRCWSRSTRPVGGHRSSSSDRPAGLIYRKARLSLVCCHHLMDRAATDSTHAFKKLYEANYQRVRQLLARIAGPHEAEDLAQMVFAKAAKALPSFHGDAQPSTWLHRIAVNVASDWLRSRCAHEAKVTDRLPETQDGEAIETGARLALLDNQPSPEQELGRKDMRDCIRGEIGKLPLGHRTVFMLSALGGLTDEEIAEILGITRGNAKVRLHRARQEFRKIIEARCDFYQTELSCKPTSPDCCAPFAAGDRPITDHQSPVTFPGSVPSKVSDET